MPYYINRFIWSCRIIQDKVIITLLFCLFCIGSLHYDFEKYNNKAIDTVKLTVKKEVHKIANKSESMKYILLWERHKYFPFNYDIERLSNIFVTRKCPQSNCLLTQDRDYLGDPLNFDAIIFQGRDLVHSDLPSNRSYHQKYIFFNMESAQYYPVCNRHFDNFFNWTSTYRLDSDIPYPYIQIKDKKGNRVGPGANVKWRKFASSKIEKSKMYDVWKNKKRTAFWLTSHCMTISRREKKAEQLNATLRNVLSNIDIFGYCGKILTKKIEKKFKGYFFQLAFENSFSEDYVTEKLTKAWTSTAIPIVYGGANYTRFLPPGSYIDASQHSPRVVANLMRSIVDNKELFMEYYKWKQYYRYSFPSKENFCSICAALHNRTLMEPSTHKEFRKWWNPDFRFNCIRKNKNGEPLYPNEDNIEYMPISMIYVSSFFILNAAIIYYIISGMSENGPNVHDHSGVKITEIDNDYMKNIVNVRCFHNVEAANKMNIHI